MRLNLKKSGFTLSELMITLALIGCLAVLTISTVGSSIQQRARLAEFRTAYSKMQIALQNVIFDKERIPACYNAPSSREISDFGLRINGNAPTDISKCSELFNDFARVMGYAKKCDDAKSDGCVPERYPIPNDCFTDSAEAYVLENGMILISKSGGLELFAIDVNGRKGPNKWGQDIFAFSTKVTETSKFANRTIVSNIGILTPQCEPVVASRANRTTEQMMKESGGMN